MAQNAIVETIPQLSLINDLDVNLVSATLTKVKTLQSTLKNILTENTITVKFKAAETNPHF